MNSEEFQVLLKQFNEWEQWLKDGIIPNHWTEKTLAKAIRDKEKLHDFYPKADPDKTFWDTEKEDC